MKTRLDPLVQLREREAESTERALIKARRMADEARALVGEAQGRAAFDARQGGQAADWELVELAHVRARLDVQRALQQASSAASEEDSRRGAVVDSQRRLEVVRRVVDRKRDELVREADHAERRSNDSMAGLLFTLARAG